MGRKVWDATTNEDDVIRFVLRRKEWHVLIEALASSCSHNDKAWNGLDVLRTAEVDVEASALVKALEQIHEYASGGRTDASTIRIIAERGLKEGAPEAKEEAKAA